jgi:hypothetical protein
MAEFTFTDEMIRAALKANGYHESWNPKDWVSDKHPNPDYAGSSPLDCFKELLRERNLI